MDGGRITRLGSQVKLQDGRVGTVVYNSLIGVGIKFGLYDPDPEDFVGTDGNTVSDGSPPDWPWEPDALLRDPWPNAPMPCVGSEVELIRWGLGEEE